MEVVAVNVWKCNSFLCVEAVAAKVEVEALEVVMKVLSASLRRLFFLWQRGAEGCRRLLRW